MEFCKRRSQKQPLRITTTKTNQHSNFLRKNSRSPSSQFVTLSFAKERAALWRSFALWASFEIGSIDKDQFEIIWKDKVAQLTTYQFNRNHTKCQQGRKEHISLKSTLQTDISRELSETTAASHTSSEQL